LIYLQPFLPSLQTATTKQIGQWAKHLDMSSNAIGLQGAKALARELEMTACTLVELNLEHNRLGDESTIILCEALIVNSSLRRLNLSRNSIADRGAASLGTLLECHDTLVELNVSWNGISGKVSTSILPSSVAFVSSSYTRCSRSGLVPYLLRTSTVPCPSILEYHF
jgi:hypothetical protein